MIGPNKPWVDKIIYATHYYYIGTVKQPVDLRSGTYVEWN